MDTQTDLEIFAALQEAFDEDKECEHPYHPVPEQRRFHGGKAEWYVQATCPNCGDTSAVLAMCDTWVQDATARMTQCSGCYAVTPTHFLVKEKIK